MLAKLKGYRTYILGWVIALAALIVQAADAVGVIDISGLLPPKYAPLGPFVVALLMLVLRRVTTTPPGKQG